MNADPDRVLGMCADLVGIDDIQHLRILFAYSMATILGAKAVALMGLSDTHESCVPLASWPVGLNLPTWRLMSADRDNDPIVWALSLQEMAHEASNRSPLIPALKARLGFCAEDAQLIVAPARFATGRFSEMVFFAAVPAGESHQSLAEIVAKFTRFSARTNHISLRFHQSRAAVDVLSRSVQNADRRENQLRQMIAASQAEILVGSSDVMCDFRESLVTLAASAPVLIFGENGTGKGLASRVLHSLSERRNGPFIGIRIADLVHAEHQLFGVSDRGPDAIFRSPGCNLLANAHGGTLFLDGISSLPMTLQARLLTACEQKVVLPPGSSQAIPADFKLIVSDATHSNTPARHGIHVRLLDRQVTRHLHSPPLRERRGDIAELAGHFLRYIARLHVAEENPLSEAALQLLNQHAYPGNVRQLQELIFDAAELAGPGKAISERHVQRLLDASNDPAVIPKSGLREACDIFERELIRRCLVKRGGNRSRVATELSIPLRTLADKLKKHGLERIRYEIENDDIARRLDRPVVVAADRPSRNG